MNTVGVLVDGTNYVIVPDEKGNVRVFTKGKYIGEILLKENEIQQIESVLDEYDSEFVNIHTKTKNFWFYTLSSLSIMIATFLIVRLLVSPEVLIPLTALTGIPVQCLNIKTNGSVLNRIKKRQEMNITCQVLEKNLGELYKQVEKLKKTPDYEEVDASVLDASKYAYTWSKDKQDVFELAMPKDKKGIHILKLVQ